MGEGFQLDKLVKILKFINKNQPVENEKVVEKFGEPEEVALERFKQREAEK